MPIKGGKREDQRNQLQKVRIICRKEVTSATNFGLVLDRSMSIKGSGRQVEEREEENENKAKSI